MELVAQIQPEMVEAEEGLYDIVIADYFEVHPTTDRAQWILFARNREISVPKTSSVSFIQQAVRDDMDKLLSEIANPSSPPPDIRARKATAPTLLKQDIAQNPVP